MGGAARGRLRGRRARRPRSARRFHAKTRPRGRADVPAAGAPRLARRPRPPAPGAISAHRRIRGSAAARIRSKPPRAAGRSLARRRRRPARRRSVREIWIDAWRWEGEAASSGRLPPAPGHRGRGPAERADGRERARCTGERTSSRGERPDASRASLPRFDTQKYPGNEVWKIMSGSASLAGSLDAVPFLAPDGDGPRIVPGTAGSVAAERGARRGARQRARWTPAERCARRSGAKTLRAHVKAAHRRGRRGLSRRGVVDLSGTRVRLDGSVVRGLHGDAVGRRRRGPGSAARSRRRRLCTPGWPRVSATRALSWRSCRRARPGGSAGLLDLRDFTAPARLRTAPGLLALSPARAEAGTFSIDADWRRARGRAWGALLIRKGTLSLGLGLGPSGAVRRAERSGRGGSKTKAGPGDSGRISRGFGRPRRARADRPSRRRERGCREGSGTVRLRRGAVELVQLRTSVFLIFAPSDPASSRTRLTESATCATVSPVRSSNSEAPVRNADRM